MHEMSYFKFKIIEVLEEAKKQEKKEICTCQKYQGQLSYNLSEKKFEYKGGCNENAICAILKKEQFFRSLENGDSTLVVKHNLKRHQCRIDDFI